MRRGVLRMRVTSAFVLACGAWACGEESDSAGLPHGAAASAATGGGSGSDGTGGSSGTGGGGGTGASAPGPSKRSACRAYLEAACARYVECGHWDEDNCLAFLRHCPDYLFSEGSTRTIEQTLECAEAWKTHDCERTRLGVPPDCATPGTRQGGETCSFIAQCESLSCSPSGDVCGTCMRFPLPGEDCSGDGIICPFGEQCVGGSCEPEDPPPPMPPPDPPPSVGELCFGACAESFVCAENPNDPSVRICQVAPATGEPCARSYQRGICGSNDYCDAQQSCVELPNAGEACGVGQYGPEYCRAGSFCDRRSDGSALCVPNGGPGDRCSTTPTYLSSYQCSTGLFCLCDDDACSTGSCRDLREEGQRCDEPHTGCDLGTRCDGTWCVAKDELTIFAEQCGSL
jgi:hypothetical protein